MKHIARPPQFPARQSLSAARKQAGVGLVEFVLVTPLVIFIGLGIVQYGMMYHAKSQLNYATFMAARAGSTGNASVAVMEKELQQALVGYYGGGTTSAELVASYTKVKEDFADGAARIEIISPTRESFDDYASPALSARLKTSARVIPNTGLAHRTCPIDKTCNPDPKTNRSGQTLSDANLLKIRITYGIPDGKQIPFIGAAMNWFLDKFLMKGDTDSFRKGLLEAGRLPIVTHTTIRMQSEPIENAAMGSSPGPGAPLPTEPSAPPPIGEPLPECPLSDPSCMPSEPPCSGPTCPTPGEPPPGGPEGPCSAAT